MISFAIKWDTTKYLLIRCRPEMAFMMLKCQRIPGVCEESNIFCIGQIPITSNTVLLLFLILNFSPPCCSLRESSVSFPAGLTVPDSCSTATLQVICFCFLFFQKLQLRCVSALICKIKLEQRLKDCTDGLVYWVSSCKRTHNFKY